MAPAGLITSLCFITNAKTYGPFGEARGTPFQIPVQSNGSIVGFFVRAGWYLDAFGVYVNPTHKTIEEEQEENDKVRSRILLIVCHFICFLFIYDLCVVVLIL